MQFFRNTHLLLLVILLVISTVGCSHMEVHPLANRGQAIGLDAKQMVKIMKRAGFSYEEILDYGPKVRNSLARNGAAQVMKSDMTQAIFVVNKPYLYVSSKENGSFTYHLEEEE